MIYAGPLAPIGLTPARVWPAPALRAGVPAIAVSRPQDNWTGDGIVAGDAVNVGPPEVPVSRRFRLVSERDGQIARETWSDPVTGAWAFPWVRRDIRWTVYALDHTGFYNGWIRTGITADPMP